MNRNPFELGGVYHLYNRGTDKREIFIDKADYRRFMRCLLHLNDENPVRIEELKNEVAPREDREKMVEILTFCLMPNHYHLLIREIKIGGITRFMRKMGTAYTMYFNKRYERSGVLFQGQFKSVVVNNDSYLRYIPHYIHLNPLDLIMDWRECKFNTNEALKYLDSYPWSSYLVYKDSLGEKSINDSVRNIIDIDFLEDLYCNKYGADLKDWISDVNLNYIQDLLLE